MYNQFIFVLAINGTRFIGDQTITIWQFNRLHLRSRADDERGSTDLQSGKQ